MTIKKTGAGSVVIASGFYDRYRDNEPSHDEAVILTGESRRASCPPSNRELGCKRTRDGSTFWLPEHQFAGVSGLDFKDISDGHTLSA